MSTPYKRKQLWVDTEFQLRLLARMAGYVLGYALFIFHVAFLLELLFMSVGQHSPKPIFTSYAEFVGKFRFFILGTLSLMPLMLYDMLKFSNRIAGPLYRCRKVMKEMAQGKPAYAFNPRKGDFMSELFLAFNDLINAWNSRLAAEREAQEQNAENLLHLSSEAHAPAESPGFPEPAPTPEPAHSEAEKELVTACSASGPPG